MTRQSKYITIYRLDYAMELAKKGHNIVSTMPNPKNPEVMAWVIEKGENFETDFQAVMKGGRRNEQNKNGCYERLVGSS